MRVETNCTKCGSYNIFMSKGEGFTTTGYMPLNTYMTKMSKKFEKQKMRNLHCAKCNNFLIGVGQALFTP